IIESAHATIVVQNLFVEKQSQALHAKETKKKNKRETLPMDGFGRHLTNPKFIAAKVEAEGLRDAEIADKAKRAEDREVAKATRDDLKQQWEQIKADHATAVELWKEKCEILTADGVLKKNLPKKPVRPLKPKPPAKVTADDGSEGSGSGSDDEYSVCEVAGDKMIANATRGSRTKSVTFGHQKYSA
ncbi:hypothetical protein B0H17DRAFT_946952, partial [Mycena rosella]